MSFDKAMLRVLPEVGGKTPHITGQYHEQRKSGLHGGVDFNYVGGQTGINMKHPTVHAPISGTVVFSGGDYGTVKIRDADGNSHEILHLDKLSVKAGQKIEAGDEIGTMGGRGPSKANQYAQHVHYQLKDAKGKNIDPTGWWNSRSQDFKGDAPAKASQEPVQVVSPSSKNGVLNKGDRGDEVQKLQEALIKQGAKINPDGIFGKETEKAVKAFQAKHQLVEDGVVGKNTQGKLNELLIDKASEKLQKPTQEKTLLEKIGGIPDEIKALYNKLDDYLRPVLESANVGQKHADAMIATGVKESVAKNIGAHEVTHAGVDKGKNLITVFSNQEHKFACFDAVAASKNDPEKTLAAAQQQLEQPQQQQQLAQNQERERSGLAMS